MMWFKFILLNIIFLLFSGMVMSDNKFETVENKIFSGKCVCIYLLQV